MIEALEELFANHFHTRPHRCEALRGSQLGASGRQILRLTDDVHTAIGVSYEVAEENAAFVGFTQHFRRLGLPVPEIYAADLEHGVYLEEDLGDLTLYQFLQAHRSPETPEAKVVDVYRRVVEWLPRFQIEGARGLDYSLCYPRAAFDEQSIAWDLNYFKYYFLKLSGAAFHEQALENDFRTLTRLLLAADSQYFLYRDFQSRNIMLRDGQPYFIDYQGGRRGALAYDLASLTFDAKAALPHPLRLELVERYLEAANRLVPLEREKFFAEFWAYAYVRTLQALGSYGYRGYFQGKPHFLASVPYALDNLRWLAQNVRLTVKLPELMRTLAALCDDEALRRRIKKALRNCVPPSLNSATSVTVLPASQATQTATLTVAIASFSFHRGPLEDASGNGGGFVFDARSLPNPGRQGQFKVLTGRDRAVADYLAAQPAVDEFFQHVAALVEQSIAEYTRRGFTHLSVAFGCTGGQHRSVYLAERLAQRLAQRDDIVVELRHREQSRWQ